MAGPPKRCAATPYPPNSRGGVRSQDLGRPIPRPLGREPHSDWVSTREDVGGECDTLLHLGRPVRPVLSERLYGAPEGGRGGAGQDLVETGRPSYFAVPVKEGLEHRFWVAMLAHEAQVIQECLRGPGAEVVGGVVQAGSVEVNQLGPARGVDDCPVVGQVAVRQLGGVGTVSRSCRRCL